MAQHNNYFARKNELISKAKEHTKVSNEKFWTERITTVANTTLFQEFPYDEQWYHDNDQDYIILAGDYFKNIEEEFTKYSGILDHLKIPNISVIDATTVQAIKNAVDNGDMVTALNFASYKNPGGMFLAGSSAQEESLCHASNLYNCLEDLEQNYYLYNRAHLNRALYTNRALYSPDVTFFSDTAEFNPFNVDILTCAAPNWNTAKNIGVQYQENVEVLKSRIEFALKSAFAGAARNSAREVSTSMHNILTDNTKNSIEKFNLLANEIKTKTLILGAFGCGVFGQDPIMVATIFKNRIIEKGLCNYFNNVVFAIPAGYNLDMFKKVFNK